VLLTITHARAARPNAGRSGLSWTDDATIVVDSDRIVSVEGGGAVPDGSRVIDAGGRLVTPGLVDSHTHAHFLGDRAPEFCERAAGVSYLDIARRGGGIRATVAATRAGAPAERIAALRHRLRRLLLGGVTTAEVKSGYGLSIPHELAFLEEIGSVIDPDLPRVSPTLLAAHAIPPEVDSSEKREGWVRAITDEAIPEVARRKLAGRVDAFVEQTAYAPDEARAVAAVAHRYGLAVHLHVDQLSDGGGAALAAEVGAQAASHLERVSHAGIEALARAGTAAVLLPTATLAAGEPQFAPARRLSDAGVPIALATNLNPGTAPTESIALLFFLASVGLHLSPEQLLWSATRGGAMALGLEQAGLLETNATPDLVIWNARDLAHLPYHAGVNHVRTVVLRGQVVVDREDAECGGAL
jgi:imidazolonepropionase